MLTGEVKSKTNDKIQIMDMVSYETLDANAPAELFEQINEGDEVTFIDLKGDVRIIEKR